MADDELTPDEAEDEHTPFAGKGYTTYSGRAMAEAFAASYSAHQADPPIYVINPFTRRPLLNDVGHIADGPVRQCSCGCAACCRGHGDGASGISTAPS